MGKYRNILSVILIFYLFFFALFVFYSIYQFTAENLLVSFMWPFIWTNSLILFINYLIPVTAAAVGIACSVSFKKAKYGPFYTMVSSNLILVITLSVIYSVLVLGVKPIVHDNLTRMSDLSKLGRVFLEQAEFHKSKKEYQEALHLFNQYQVIDPENKKILEEINAAGFEEARGKIEMNSEKSSKSEIKPEESLKEADAYDFLKKAQQYFDAEDYYSAHYYATRSYGIDKERRDAYRLARDAWNKITSLEPDKKQKKALDLYKIKKKGYEAFNSGEFIYAYHLFNKLIIEHPDDPDIRNYHKKSLEKVAGISYFLEDARKIDPLPGIEDLLFVNKIENGEHEIVSLGKAAFFNGEMFFKDIEVIRFNERGIQAHFQADYGKLIELDIGSYVNMRGISRDNQDKQVIQEYFNKGGSWEKEDNLFLINPPIQSLNCLKRNGDEISNVSFGILWQFREGFAQFGYMEEKINIELLMRVVLPFSFLILTIFSISLGWSFRMRITKRPPVISFIFMPLFPFITAFFTYLYLGAQQTILGFLLVSLGFSSVLICMLIVQGILLTLVLIYLAGQKTG